MNSSFYKNRGGVGDITELTPFRGTQDSKGFAFDRGASAEDIPRETFYNEGAGEDDDNIQRVKIISDTSLNQPSNLDIAPRSLKSSLEMQNK